MRLAPPSSCLLNVGWKPSFEFTRHENFPSLPRAQLTNQVSSGNSRERKGIKKYPFPIQINSTNRQEIVFIKKRYLFIIKAIHLPVFLSYLSYVSIHIIYVCIRPLSVDVSEGYDVFAPLHTNLIYVSNLIQNFLLLPLLLIVQVVRSKQVNLCQVRSTQFQLSFLYSAVVSAQVSYCLSPAASRQLFSQSAASA